MVGESIDLSAYVTGAKASREDIARLNDMVHEKVLQLREELDRRIRSGRKKRNS